MDEANVVSAGSGDDAAAAGGHSEESVSAEVVLRKNFNRMHKVSSQPCLASGCSSRKHHSAPVPPSSNSLTSSDGPEEHFSRSRFERRQIWSSSKQGSFDLPEDLPACPEDNVFADSHSDSCGGAVKGWRVTYQRSFSVPATLPDVVQEANTKSGDSSPDVLLKGEAEDRSTCDAKVDTDTGQGSDRNFSSANNSVTSAEFTVSEWKEQSSETDASYNSNTSDDQSLKLMFEGPVCDSQLPQVDKRRRKSVSFDTAVDIVKMVSAKGRQAREHFRSSGYGSQSEGSHNSQKSGNTSHEGSVMSDDVLVESCPSALSSVERSSFETGFGGSVEKGSFESGYGGLTDQCACSLNEEQSPTHIDGSIDGSDTGTPKGGSSSDSSEHSQTLSVSSASNLEAASRTADTEACRNVAHICQHTEAMSDAVPCLSIFENLPSVKETSDGSVVLPGVVGGDFSYQRNRILEGSDSAEQSFDVNAAQLPFQQEAAPVHTVGPYSIQRQEMTEPHSDRFSPTSVQREMVERLFYEKMEKFDPQNENISDLLNWMKNNVDLTPSPKSPFFPAEGSPHSITLPPSIAAALGITTVPAAAPRVSNQLQANDDHGYMQQGLAGEALQESQPVRHPIPGYGPSGQLSTHMPAKPGTHPSAASGSQQMTVTQKSGASQGMSSSAAQSRQGSGQQSVGTRGTGSNVMQSRLCAPNMFSWQQASHTHSPVPAVVAEGELAAPECRFSCQQMSRPESSVGLPSAGSLGTGVSESSLERVQKLSQCCELHCSDGGCVEWKLKVQNLRDAIRRGESLSADNKDVVKILCGHYKECDQPNCLVPWCRLICRWYRSGREIRPHTVETALSNPVHTLLPMDFRATSFLELNSRWSFQTMPKEWEHWLLLCPLSQSQMVIRAVPIVVGWPNTHWAIKLTTLHEGRNQLEVLQSLRNLQPNTQNLIPHLWAAADERNDLLVVCTEYQPGISLKELLSQRMRLEYSQSYMYLLQILSALEQLHTSQIVYLNWDSSNFLLDQSCQRLKVTNFTSSYQLPGHNADLGNIKLSLPADIIPPEFFVNGGELQYKSDSWGVACLLYELLTGGRPWYHLRHCRQEDIWRQIKKQVPPELSRHIPIRMYNLLEQCFKRSPDKRLSASYLTTCIQQELHTVFMDDV